MGGLVKGIAIVHLVHTDGNEYDPINYRIYSKQDDGKTKNDHFQERLINAMTDKPLKEKTILFDNGCAAWQNLKLVQSLNLMFYTTLKNNR